MSSAKRTARVPSSEIQRLPQAKKEADKALYVKLRAFLPDADEWQQELPFMQGTIRELGALSNAHRGASPQGERILNGFCELGQLLTTPIRDDFCLMQHLPVALQTDDPRWAALPIRQAVKKLLELACQSKDMRGTATDRQDAGLQLATDINDYLQAGMAEEIGIDLQTIARTFFGPEAKELTRELTEGESRFVQMCVGGLASLPAPVVPAEQQAGSPAAAKTPEVPIKTAKRERKEIETAAIAALITIGPNATQIALAVKVCRTTLLGWPEFKKRYKQVKDEARQKKATFPKGQKSSNGKVEAWDTNQMTRGGGEQRRKYELDDDDEGVE